MTEQRMEIDGLKQYKAIVLNSDGTSASSFESSDWFENDEAAQSGFVQIMAEQGYSVESVVIGFPCVITLSPRNRTQDTTP